MAEQKAALQAPSQYDVRGEADRACAILLTLKGCTSPQVAQTFGVTADAVQHWRGWFSERGVDALRSTLVPGPSFAKKGACLGAAKKGDFAWRRPWHILSGRQDKTAVERTGVRLRLHQAQAQAATSRCSMPIRARH